MSALGDILAYGMVKMCEILILMGMEFDLIGVEFYVGNNNSKQKLKLKKASINEYITQVNSICMDS